MYYSRYFQMNPGKTFPRGPWLLTPRGDLGYAGFYSFIGDNGCFALVLGIGSWDRELRVLQHEAAWDAAASSIPMIAPLIDRSFATPITPVLPMGELQNTFRHYVEAGEPRLLGFVPVGDTVCHTDPTFALGLSFALIHARAVRSAIAAANTPAEILPLFWSAIYPETRERYDFAVAADNARAAMWQGEKLDVLHRDGCYPLFTMVATAMAALHDDEVLRKTVRRTGFLDRLSVFDDDIALQEKVERIVAELLRTHNLKRPMPRKQWLQRATDAVRSTVLR